MGDAGAAPVGTSRPLPRCNRKARGPAPDLSGVREPRGNRAPRRATRGRGAVAARPGWYAALSGQRGVAYAPGTGAVAGFRRAIRMAARHGRGLRARRHLELDRT